MIGGTMVVDARLERERGFHDDRFHDDSARAAAGRFYALAEGARSAYSSVLDRIRTGARVLEYGAGTGGDGFSLARRGIRVVGIDLSPVAVDQANASARSFGLEADQCRYVVGDAEHLEFADNSFEAVFGSGILHHLDLSASMAEIHRVLSPGGSAVFFEPMGHNPAVNLYRRFTPAMRTADEHPILASDIEAMEEWFATVHAQFHVLSTFAAVPFRRWSRYPSLVAKLNDFDARLLQRFPALSRFGWIVVLQLEDPRPLSTTQT